MCLRCTNRKLWHFRWFGGNKNCWVPLCYRSRAHFSTVRIPASKIKSFVCMGFDDFFFHRSIGTEFSFLTTQLNVSWQTRGFGLYFTPRKSSENCKRSAHDSDTSAGAIIAVSANSVVADICYVKRKCIKYRRTKSTSSYVWHTSARSGEIERN